MAELKVSNVSKSFDGVKILEDISIELHDQELVSLLGVSGGGKTTLFNVISGLESRRPGMYIWMAGRSQVVPEMSAICCRRTCFSRTAL